MFKARAFANKARAFVTSKASTATGWQLEVYAAEDEFKAIQTHYVRMKLTKKQVRTLIEMPFFSMTNLTEPDNNCRYVVATNLVLTKPDGKETILKVARKEWKHNELVAPYLAE